MDARKEEARAYAEFSIRDSAPEHRPVLADLYAAQLALNREHFGGRLSLPHFRLGRTAPRSLGHLSEFTGYGALWESTLNERLVLPPLNLAWVLSPGGEGHRRFVHDLVLRFMACQWVREIDGTAEAGYEGFGPHFCQKANSIALSLPLTGQVIPRRRGREDAHQPIGKGWPHCVRPEGYYGDDITEALLDLATGGNYAERGKPGPPTLGLLEFLLSLLNNKATDRARDIIIRHLDRLQSERLGRRHRNYKAERGLTDLDGTPLGEVTFEPRWLVWENGIVHKLAEAMHAWRSFSELPILADALEESGCSDGRILRHLRARIEHTRHCWVLRGILAVNTDKL